MREVGLTWKSAKLKAKNKIIVNVKKVNKMSKMSKMSNEGQELILLLIMGLIIFKLMSTDPIYSTNGRIDSDKITNIVQEFKYKHRDEIQEIRDFIRGE